MTRRILLAAGLVLCAAMAWAATDHSVSHAQTPDPKDEFDFVDLEVKLDIIKGSLEKSGIEVSNLGQRTAYDLEVVVEIVFPDLTDGFDVLSRQGRLPVGTLVLENDNKRARWSIPKLEGGSKVVYTIDHADTNMFAYYEIVGTVSSQAFESQDRMDNNTHVMWRQTRSSSAFHRTGGYHLTTVSVDDPYPSPGETVNFTVTATKGSDAPMFDARVEIDFSGGLGARNGCQ